MLLIAISIAFLFALALFPIIIRFVRSIDLLDQPDKRKIHTYNTPSLGGIAIFCSICVSLIFTVSFSEIVSYKFFLAGMTIIFILGIRDDISSLYANQKFIYQLLAAFLAVYFADIRLIGLYGVFGIGEMNELLSGLFSMFVIIGLINAFNLIDGIDGLAGSVALVNSIVFGVYFYLLGHVFFLYVSMVLAGAIIAFLLFNWHPSKIFMGDTGSLLIGYILISMAIVFINQNVVQPVTTTSVSLSFALLIIPVYDTIRVILLRLSQGRSPFYPDKKHIHHILLKQGFNHSQSTLILVTFNMLVVLFVFQFDFLGDTTLLLSIGILSFLFGLFFDLRLIRVMKNDKKRARENQTLHISKSA